MSNSNGYTVNSRESLTINEQGQKISIKIDDIDEPFYEKDFYNTVAYIGIKFSITNPTNKEETISLYNFTLLDSNDNEIDTQQAGYPTYFSSSGKGNQVLDSKIPANQTINGYLFFQSDLKDIKRLRISCMTDKITKNHDLVFGKDVYYEYY